MWWLCVLRCCAGLLQHWGWFSYWNNLDVANSAWCRAGNISVRMFVMCVGCNQYIVPSYFSIYIYITFVAVAAKVIVFRYPRLPLTMAVTALDILEKFESLNMFESFSFYRCVFYKSSCLGFPATALDEEIWSCFTQAFHTLVELLEDQVFGLGAPDCLWESNFNPTCA